MPMPRTRNPNGMGTIYKTKKNIYEWRQMVDGEKRLLSSKDLTVLKEKIKEVADLPIIKEKIKASDWFEKWLNVYIKPLRKNATYEQYKNIYKIHIEPAIGKKLMKNIKRYDIQQVIATMNTRTIPARKDKKGKITVPEKPGGMSEWTMKHARKVMHSAFQQALDDKIIVENPVINIKIPKKQKSIRKVFTAAELVAIFQQLSTSRWIWALRFMLVTGLRRGELLGLKWSDILYEDRKVAVMRSNSDDGIGDTKSAKIHYAPLSDSAVYYLNRHKEVLEKECNPILYNEDLKKTELIFPNESGKMLQAKSFYTMLVRAAKKVNVKATVHMFRHTFVYISKGLISLSELQEALGHGKKTTTLDLYGDMLSDTIDTSKKIDKAFLDLEKEMEKIENKEDTKIIPFRRVR